MLRYRERVYCYELYHQLRLALKSFPYSLQGEMDKDSHPIIRSKKPDFILHRSGTMYDNLVVMEVKSLNNTSNNQLKKDLDTLSYFLKDAQYYRVVHLIYGFMKKNDGNISKVIEAYKEYEHQSGKQDEFEGKLLLYWHSKYGEPAKVYDWERKVFMPCYQPDISPPT